MDESAKKKLTFRGNLISILDNVEWINEDLEQRSWPFVRKMSQRRFFAEVDDRTWNYSDEERWNWAISVNIKQQKPKK